MRGNVHEISATDTRIDKKRASLRVQQGFCGVSLPFSPNYQSSVDSELFKVSATVTNSLTLHSSTPHPHLTLSSPQPYPTFLNTSSSSNTFLPSTLPYIPPPHPHLTSSSPKPYPIFLHLILI
ncbi:hypothetical protein RRG08_041244 [Elysia crispata]|uniref:Uncharacterized protein n=1 Tax=Elysia crispata TaxID=231223 RepID=A0AAE1D5Y6_9GAST|nr:hypothetical protein RRG08_041244 [Elysia crispata]